LNSSKFFAQIFDSLVLKQVYSPVHFQRLYGQELNHDYPRLIDITATLLILSSDSADNQIASMAQLLLYK